MQARLLSSVVTFFLLTAGTAGAGSPRCTNFDEATLKQMALELLQQDLAGARLPDQSVCLSQLKPQMTIVAHSPLQEGGHTPEWIPDKAEIKVLGVKPEDAGGFRSLRAKVQFELRYAGKLIRDDIEMLLNYSPEDQAQNGCGAPLSWPKVWRVRESCKKTR